MDQMEARGTARDLNLCGIAAIADNRGGWGGSESAGIWGVRPARDDGLTGIYESVAQMPPKWQEALRLVAAVDTALERQKAHLVTHEKNGGRAACNRCALLSEAVDAAAARMKGFVDGE